MSRFAELKEAAQADALGHCALFHDMQGDEIGGIAGITQAKAPGKGAHLCREGDKSRGAASCEKARSPCIVSMRPGGSR